MHLRAKHMHIKAQLVASSLNILQSFLVIRSGASDPDLDFVFVQLACEFADRADDAFEC